MREGRRGGHVMGEEQQTEKRGRSRVGEVEAEEGREDMVKEKEKGGG